MEKNLTKSLKPILVAFDSSILIDISKDFYHEEGEKKQKASEILKYIEQSAIVPVVTWHHIEELLAYSNEHVALNSLNIFKYFPVVAYLKCLSIPNHAGSIIDIEVLEIKNVLNNKKISLKNNVNKTKQHLFEYCSGSELIEPYIQNASILRYHILSRENKKKEIASISRANSIRSKETNVSTLRNGKFRSPDEAYRILEQMRINLERELKLKGDKKLNSPEESSTNFLTEVFESGMEMLNSNGSVEERFLKSFGLTVEETKNFQKLEQIQYLAIFKKRREIISRSLSINERLKVSELKEEKCPSWLLWKELNKIRVEAEKASGSDLNDGYLAALVYYVDVTIVDKRTNEYLSQVKRKHKHIAELMRKFVKLPNYTYLPNICIK